VDGYTELGYQIQRGASAAKQQNTFLAQQNTFSAQQNTFSAQQNTFSLPSKFSRNSANFRESTTEQNSTLQQIFEKSWVGYIPKRHAHVLSTSGK